MNGSCLCGAVAFTVEDCRTTVTFCHCRMCRAWSGHYWAATRAPLSRIAFQREDGLRWFRSSDHAERGFCGTCGSSLFYRPVGADHIGIAAGSLEGPTGLTPGKHIFCASRGDYYDVPEDCPHVPD